MTSELSANLINGLSAEFNNTYKDVANRTADERLRMVMDVDGVQATNSNHDYGYKESAPHFEEWPRGANIPTEGIAGKSYNVVNHKFGKRIQWDEEEREDDQLGDLMEVARTSAEGAGLLAEEFFFDLLLGTTATLPGTVIAPDGSSMFVSTARFGHADGNIVAGGTVGTTAGVVSIYYNVMARFRAFQDTKGKPLWKQPILDQGVVIVFSSAYEKVFEEAFLQKINVGVVTTAGTTNIFDDARRKVTLWPTTYITDDDVYFFLKGAPIKPTFIQNRRGVRERSSLGDDNNSDSVRTTGKEYYQVDLRQGAGINVVYGAIEAQPA
jgi:hypothetical protein